LLFNQRIINYICRNVNYTKYTIYKLHTKNKLYAYIRTHIYLFCETLNISIVYSPHNSNYRCRNLFFNVTYKINVITILHICTVNIYLLYFYYRNVSISVNECYTKPLRAAKLKDSISEALLLFLYIYRELSEVSLVVCYITFIYL